MIPPQAGPAPPKHSFSCLASLCAHPHTRGLSVLRLFASLACLQAHPHAPGSAVLRPFASFASFVHLHPSPVCLPPHFPPSPAFMLALTPAAQLFFAHFPPSPVFLPCHLPPSPFACLRACPHACISAVRPFASFAQGLWMWDPRQMGGQAGPSLAVFPEPSHPLQPSMAGLPSLPSASGPTWSQVHCGAVRQGA